MKKLTLLIILLFSQSLFLFSLSGVSLRTLLSTKPKELLVYSYHHAPIKTSGLCVVGLCILFGGVHYSYKQIKKDNKNEHKQEKKYLEITESITQIVTGYVKNIFLSFGTTRKNIKTSKKITNNLEKTASNTQKKIRHIQTSISNINTQCNSLEQSGKNIIKTTAHMKKKSSQIQDAMNNIIDKKIKRNKTAENIIDSYNEQIIVPLSQVKEELHEKLADCSYDIKQSKEKINSMVKVNEHTIATLKKNSLEIKKNTPKEEIKLLSRNNKKMETV